MRLSRSTVIALIFFIVLDSMAFYAAYIKRKAEFSPITLTAMVPDVIWQAFDGKKHKLKDWHGHPIVLHFWASWCPPCRDEFPKLLKAATDNPDIMFLAISSDEDKQKAMNFIKRVPDVSGIKSPANMFYAWDPKRSVTYDQFLTARYPESILVDSKGYMRRKYPIPVEWTSKETQAYLMELKGTNGSEQH